MKNQADKEKLSNQNQQTQLAFLSKDEQKYFSKPFVRYFIRSFFSVLLPILLSILFLVQFIIGNYEVDSRARLQAILQNIVQDLNAELSGLSNTASQAASFESFKNKYIQSTPTAFISIRETLEAINYSNRLLHGGGVSFFSSATPNLFYTEMGTFNETYYRTYLDETRRAVTAKQILKNVDYCTIIPNYSMDRHLISNPSLDVIYAFPKQQGSYLIFSISENVLNDMLVLEAYQPDEVLLLDRNGRKLYPVRLDETYPEQLMRQSIDQQQNSQTIKRDGKYELITAHSTVNGFRLGYWVKNEYLFGELNQMRILLYSFILGMTILGCVVLIIFSRGESTRIYEVSRLIKLFYHQRSISRGEVVFDRTQTLLTDLCIPKEQSEIVRGDGIGKLDVQVGQIKAKESKTADLSKEQNQFNVDHMIIESTLVKRVILFINAHQGNSELNVSILSNTFGVELSNLSHQFKNATGYLLSDYVNAKKLYTACEWLKDSSISINELAEKLGYSHASSFSRNFKKFYGVTPAQYRKDVSDNMEP